MKGGEDIVEAGLPVSVRNAVVERLGPDGLVRALDCPCLDIAAGTSLAISGPSGSGKSTLLGLLATIETPTSGEVWIGDTRVDVLSEVARTRFRRSRIGMVYQKDNLLPFLTVAENIRLQLAVIGRKKEAAERVDRLLRRLGLDDLGSRLPDQLSGGQRQRAAVARAFVHEPALILADEPTGALDKAAAEKVVALLTEASAVFGTTLVVATHNPQVVLAMDHHLQLLAGRPQSGRG